MGIKIKDMLDSRFGNQETRYNVNSNRKFWDNYMASDKQRNEKFSNARAIQSAHSKSTRDKHYIKPYVEDESYVELLDFKNL